MKYTIIEDCSPYYIRFTHNNIDLIIDKCLSYVRGVSFPGPFLPYAYNQEQSTDILSSVPLTDELNLNYSRVKLFVTQPGCYYRAHKDGLNCRYGINYTVKALDDKCITSWYSDDDLKDYPVDNFPGQFSRECLGFDKRKHVPIKSMTAVQSECTLFNTELFHDFDNTASTNERMILTLRDTNPGLVYFDDAKKRIWGG